MLAATNVALPLNQWTVLAPAIQISSGQYQFTDGNVTNYTERFYQMVLAGGRSPSNGNLNYRVQITPEAGGADVLSVTNTVTSGASFTSKAHSFNIPNPGTYIIKFTAVSGNGPTADNTALITQVAISPSS